MLKPYICTQCGGKVNPVTLTCEMCGTRFKEEGVMRLVVDRPGVHIIQCTRAISKDALYTIGPEAASEYVLKDMSREIAQSLFPMLDVMTEDDLPMHEKRIRAQLRVLEPTYRF